MELSKLVKYDSLFRLELRNPDTDRPIGLVMHIRSAQSEEAKDLIRKQTDKNIERRMKSKLPKSRQMEQEELEKAAAYIASWEWGVNPDTQEQLMWKGKIPDLKTSTAMEIFDEASWIFEQVVGAAGKIGNFMEPSKVSSVED